MWLVAGQSNAISCDKPADHGRGAHSWHVEMRDRPALTGSGWDCYSPGVVFDGDVRTFVVAGTGLVEWMPGAPRGLVEKWQAFAGPGPFAGLVWVHGEGDAARVADAREYRQRLGDVIGWVDAPTCIVLVHRNSARAEREQVRGEQLVYAYEEGATVADVDDQDLKDDGIHYPGSVMRVIGERCR